MQRQRETALELFCLGPEIPSFANGKPGLQPTWLQIDKEIPQHLPKRAIKIKEGILIL